MNLIPTVTYKNNEGERSYDIFSLLLNQRIIVLNGEINDTSSALVVAQLLYLSSIDTEKDISLYINSPGGSITAGMAIYDTMNFIKCDVSTICVGMCASMGAFLLAGGKKGKRYALPNSEIMIHQPLGGAQGQATDVSIIANRLLKVKKRINEILANNTNKPLEQIEKDTERDYFLDPNDALDYGLIDKIIESNH